MKDTGPDRIRILLSSLRNHADAAPCIVQRELRRSTMETEGDESVILPQSWVLPLVWGLFLGAMTLTALPAAAATHSTGALLYRSCAQCHGDRGEGSKDGTVPAVAGQPYPYLLQQIMDFRTAARPASSADLRMHAAAASRWAIRLDQGVVLVARYLAAIPPVQIAVTGEGRDLEKGAVAYQSRCAVCHGRSGEGRRTPEPSTPWLAGQHYPYLERQLRAVTAGHRLKPARALAESLAGLTDDDRNSIADYLSRLPRIGVD